MIELQNGRIYMGGIYEARVVSNNDPSNLNRIKVRVFAIHDDTTAAAGLPWAKASHNTYGNDSGDKKRPNVGTVGWVMFEKGDADYPVWIGGQLEPGDTRSGTRADRIDGDDKVDVKRDRQSTIGRDEKRTVEGNETVTVKKTSTQTYEDLDVVVVDGIKYLYGRLEGETTGDEEVTVGGSRLYKILGHEKLTVAESLELSIGGSERRFVAGQMFLKAANATGQPGADALYLEATNGRLSMVAKNIAGIEGSGILLDPFGIASEIRSLANFGIRAQARIDITAPLTTIGPASLATVPIATAPHTHTIFGIPTTTVNPGPGLPLSVLGPPI